MLSTRPEVQVLHSIIVNLDDCLLLKTLFFAQFLFRFYVCLMYVEWIFRIKTFEVLVLN